ncbi:MAG: AN1-type zinc finger domain-containing protein [Candidatus Thorarchaeota archaeon]
MTYCEFCGDQISYLPFTCKYCGGTFCKKHRLPENHECSFELKHIPVVPTTQREPRRGYQEARMKTTASRVYLDKEPRSLKKYLKRQDKLRLKSYKQTRAFSSQFLRFKGTNTIFLLIIIFSILGVIFTISGIGEYILFSLNSIATKFTYYTFFTALFIDPMNPLDPFFFFFIFFILIMYYFTYKLAKFIEMANGAKFLVKLFLLSGLFSMLFYFILRIALIAYYPVDYNSFFDAVGLVWGGIYGIISFTIFPSINRETTAMLTFIRMRMTGKSFLFILIFIRLFFGLIYGIYEPLYILFYLPELGGILAAYLVYKYRIFSR